ncbi:MAG: hydroxymethylbilane synthase [Naasia sp.]
MTADPGTAADPGALSVIRLGTRGSTLALAQAGHIAADLERVSGIPVELVPITSEGDVNRASLSVIGGQGVFAGSLRTALLDGRCDVVVHSLKDLPTVPADGLVVAAVPPRADARDVLCAPSGTTLDSLPAGARVGTGSPRRIAQLAARRPDLEIVDLRGNVDSRLARVRSGELHAVVLSLAGLERIGRTDEVSEYLDLETWPTAPGQGALAIEVRAEDARHLREPFPQPTPLGAAVSLLTDPASESATEAERAVLRGLGAGCTAPVAVAAVVGESTVDLHAAVYAPRGERRVEERGRTDFDPSDPADLEAVVAALAASLVEQLLAGGAADLAPLGAAS